LTTYNVVAPGSMVSGQPEDISVVLANFNAIAAVLNGNIDNANIKADAAIATSKLAGYPDFETAAHIRAGGDVFARIAQASQVMMGWVAGGNAGFYFGNGADTDLYRAGAGSLKTDGEFSAVGVANFHWSANPNWSVILGAPANGLTIGSDANLYRVSPGILKTDGGFKVGSYVQAAEGYTTEVLMGLDFIGGGQAGIRFGSEVNMPILYRSGPYLLRVSEALEINQALTVGKLINAYVNLVQDSAGIYMGTTSDVQLYRSGPGVLAITGAVVTTQGLTIQRSDGGAGYFYNPGTATGLALYSAVAAENQPRFYVDVNGYHRWGPGGATAPDTELFRSGVGYLTTSGMLMVQAGIYSGAFIQAQGYIQSGISSVAGQWAFLTSASGDAGNRLIIQNDGKITWGSGGPGGNDTALYRAASSYLKTDGGLGVDGTFDAGWVGSAAAYALRVLPANAIVQDWTGIGISYKGSGATTFQGVRLGAANSGGAGLRVLVVPN